MFPSRFGFSSSNGRYDWGKGKGEEVPDDRKKEKQQIEMMKGKSLVDIKD